MPKKNRVVLQPEYLSRFSCIGGACEDSCCSGWRVSVDKKTFLEYRRVKDKALAPLLDEFVKRERKEGVKSDEAYAKINMVKGRCPLQDAQNLCLIQTTLGYGALCDVCAVYPRLYKIIDKKLERCATVSCPEAARLVLNNPDGIGFETVEEGKGVGRIPDRAPSLAPGDAKYAAKPAKFFWEIRMVGLTLLQNREYTVGQRLILLGLLCRKIDELDESGRVEEIPNMLETFGASVDDGSLRPDLDAVEGSFGIQLRLAKELTDERLKMELIASKVYLVCMVETLAGIEFVADTPEATIMKKYVENRDKYVLPYLKDKEYVLENFVVNEFFARLMPISINKTAWDSYLYLCVLFGMVKLHLNGMGGFHKGLTDEIVVRIVQAFSKMVLHNGKFIPGMIEKLKANGFDTLGWMTILVSD
ncbi:MAG: flagellin lysine-N-methylase [Chitinispirillales bacterium]|jgi:lysine-N-methylase|nr:flagellin lysine-N-methylase [Chitinispirillales bacterium]